MAAAPKTALVTGCSSGIGEATAWALANVGHRVIATARNIGDLENLGKRARNANLALEIRSLDVSSMDSVDSVFAEIGKNGGHLDVLVNNAGYALLGAIEDVPMADLRRQFDVNVMGLVAVYRGAVPLMRRSGSGTIVNVSSVAGRVSVPLLGVYCASKFAVEALSDAMRGELHQFGIRVVSIEPGPVRTRFSENAVKASAHIIRRRDTPYQRAYVKLRAMYEDGASGIPPEKVARVIVKAVRSKRPRARYAIGLKEKVFVRMGSMVTTRVGQRAVRGYFSLNP